MKYIYYLTKYHSFTKFFTILPWKSKQIKTDLDSIFKSFMMRSIEKLRKKSKSFPTQNENFENWDTFPIFNLEEAQKNFFAFCMI